MAKDRDNEGGFATPEERAVLRQEVELRGGTRMSHSTARWGWEVLQSMQSNEPAEFEALVAIVIHKHPLGELPEAALAGLRKGHVLRSDGVLPDLALVLAASYQEPSPDRLVLRYPIIHTSSEQVEQIQTARDTAQDRFARKLLKDIEDGRRQGGSKDDDDDDKPKRTR